MSGFSIWLYGAALVALCLYVFMPKPKQPWAAVIIGAGWPLMVFFLFLAGLATFIWWILTGDYCERPPKRKRK